MSINNKQHSRTPFHKKIRLQNLQDGTPFTIEGLEKQFTCLYLVRGGDSTCKVQGYKLTDSGGYTPFADFFSPATEVLQDTKRKALTINKDGMLSIPKEYAPVKDEEEKTNKKTKVFKVSMNMETNQTATAIAENAENETEDAAKRGAGRPRKHSINLPHGEEFTVNAIAEKLGVKKFVVNNELNKIKRENPDSVQVVGTIPQGKGKPARVFKLI